VGESKKQAVIIGAGPAGITAGIELLKTKKFSATIVERDSVVGGLAKTTEFKGCRYDIGPHHFITSDKKIERWWKDLMQGDFFKHKRFTRIFYNKHFFHYPLEPMNVLRGLNIFTCIACIVSYFKYRLFPIKKINSFQDWVTNRFGYKLFSIFFKTYTEKVWGIPCTKISADWSAARIKGFSLSKAIFYAFFGRFFSEKNRPRTIRDDFYYPSKGSGTLWNKAAKQFESLEKSNLLLNQEVVSIEHNGSKVKCVSTKNTQVEHSNAAQKLTPLSGDYFFSTMPLKALVNALDPLPDNAIVSAANALQYRGLITVNLIINKRDICPDHWLYVHEKSVRMGRIGNMNNFSMDMVDNPEHTALSLEYFAYVDEPFWRYSEQELVALGTHELATIGLVDKADVIDGFVMKTSEAYPVYDEQYHEHLNAVLEYLKQFDNLQLMGRNGLHRYNNMDVAMLSAMQAVDRVVSNVSIDISKNTEKASALRA
jgi:protoporphyrinogen oxidase